MVSSNCKLRVLCFVYVVGCVLHVVWVKCICEYVSICVSPVASHRPWFPQRHAERSTRDMAGLWGWGGMWSIGRGWQQRWAGRGAGPARTSGPGLTGHRQEQGIRRRRRQKP